MWPPEAIRQSSGNPRIAVGLLLFEPGCVDMPFEVVYPDHRQIPRQGQRLGRIDSNQQRAGEAGAAGDGHSVEAPQLDARLVQGRPDHGHDGHQMAPRRDLGHDAAKGGVYVRLAGDHVGADGSPHPLSRLRPSRRRTSRCPVSSFDHSSRLIAQ